ncbi:DUF6318 family protein [Actinotalea ferrariae]|uniref:DUF6318 family protein n=1 Tax=Actinotalea ferrariae TaxID=1386098 RepID=UPI0012DE61A3|nr:DUF6318 family protein [Actinotalea ferrariae]
MLVAVGVAVGAGLLAGCSEPSESVPTPTAEASERASVAAPGPTPDPTPEANPEPVPEPVPSPEMERGGEAGAIAAAEYFMRLSEYAFLTGDLATWNEISTTDCGYCNNVRERVDRVWGEGGRIKGAALRVGSPRVDAVDDQLGIYAVAVDYFAAPAQELDASGALLNDLPGGEGVFIVEVVLAADGWRLIEAARPAPEDT